MDLAPHLVWLVFFQRKPLKGAAGQVKTRDVTFSGQNSSSGTNLSAAIAAALDWWQEAGVDLDYDDAAHDWLAGAAPAVTAEPAPPILVMAPKPPPPPAQRIGGEPGTWPTEHSAFVQWWLSEPLLDSGQVFARVAPRGPREAPIMVLVDHPEAGDSDRLLSGEEGRLLDAILRAMGIEPSQAYVASVLPRHMPLPDWDALAAAGLGELALHHVALAAPQRLITFGKHVSSLLGNDPAKSADPGRHFYQVGAGIPALAAPALGTLMARPRGKAGLWRALLEWQGA